MENLPGAWMNWLGLLGELWWENDTGILAPEAIMLFQASRNKSLSQGMALLPIIRNFTSLQRKQKKRVGVTRHSPTLPWLLFPLSAAQLLQEQIYKNFRQKVFGSIGRGRSLDSDWLDRQYEGHVVDGLDHKLPKTWSGRLWISASCRKLGAKQITLSWNWADGLSNVRMGPHKVKPLTSLMRLRGQAPLVKNWPSIHLSNRVLSPVQQNSVFLTIIIYTFALDTSRSSILYFNSLLHDLHLHICYCSLESPGPVFCCREFPKWPQRPAQQLKTQMYLQNAIRKYVGSTNPLLSALHFCPHTLVKIRVTILEFLRPGSYERIRKARRREWKHQH